MIRLHPIPEASRECPHCRAGLECVGWYVPGMRCLADLLCRGCGRGFYGDLASGQALYTPMLLEKETGAVQDLYGVEWFAAWLRDSYARRRDESIPFEVRERLPIEGDVVVLNCLDTLYGHSLLKLLNAQRHLERERGPGVVVVVPPFLEWMIPEGVAQAWVVGLPPGRGTEWNDWLARELRRRIEALRADNVYLSLAFSHPHPEDFRVERFTRVRPFPLAEWERRAARPTVTFIWREDRLWGATGGEAAPGYLKKIGRRIRRPADAVGEQLSKVLLTAEALRREWPSLDFALAGIGEPGRLPDWVTDLRRVEPDATTERVWCERYAASQLVFGVHGSNMLLPSAHAGGVIEIIGDERRGNFLQDILFRAADCRETLFLNRFVPHETTPAALAGLLTFILRGYPDFRRLMSPEFCRHDGEAADVSRWLSAKKKV